jgi:hypothetical protein
VDGISHLKILAAIKAGITADPLLDAVKLSRVSRPFKTPPSGGAVERKLCTSLAILLVALNPDCSL